MIFTELLVTGETKGASKSPGSVYIRKKNLEELKQMLSRGIKSTRVKKHKHGKGRLKTITLKEEFKVPKDDYSFFWESFMSEASCVLLHMRC